MNRAQTQKGRRFFLPREFLRRLFCSSSETLEGRIGRSYPPFKGWPISTPKKMPCVALLVNDKAIRFVYFGDNCRRRVFRNLGLSALNTSLQFGYILLTALYREPRNAHFHKSFRSRFV